MTDLIAELAEVVRLCDAASAMLPSAEGNEAIKSAETAATNWVMAHAAEIEAMARDARRYRWLRDKANDASVTAPMCLMVNGECAPAFDKPGYGHNSARIGEALDAAIDAAMRSAKEDGK